MKKRWETTKNILFALRKRYVIVRAFFIISLFLVLSPGILKAQEVQQDIPEKMHILFLLDGSGSMLAEWKDERRIDVAKRILSGLVDSLRANTDIELALRVYGHRYAVESNNCQDTRLEVPFSPDNHDQIIVSLKNIKPRGTTPIAYSLQQAASDFPTKENYRNIIIIITDGIESCDGDPCAVSLELQRKGIFLKPFVVGIGGMSDDFDKQFECVGKYYDANDEVALQSSLTNVIETTLAKTTATVELQDKAGNSRYTNINVTFENEFTGTPAFDFIHYLDENDNPDTVRVDPVLTYNIVVNTLPQVKRNVNIIPGHHNHIALPTPQGKVAFNQKGAKTYGHTVQAVIKKRNGDVFHIQGMNSTESYLEGQYEAVVSTLPRRTFPVTVKEGQVTTIDLMDPGIINMYNSTHGYGSIYAIDENNTQQWVADIKPEKSQTTWVLQPGSYKVVFRSKNARGSKYTAIKEFTVKSGESQTLRLF